MENGTAVASMNGGGGVTTPLVLDTSTSADEEMNGLDLSTKSSNSTAAAAAGPITLTTSSSNGSNEGTPTPGTPLNGSPEKGLEAGQISPSSLRRSTRASAIKAQQKIKDGDVPQAMDQENNVESEDESMGGEEKKQEVLDGESAAKKRKLENGKALDQFSHEFSIKMEEDGGVYMLDEGSEMSSLNESEIETLKKCYDKLLARELTSEQKEERTRMIKQAEADLRNEEAKLTMLKKMRASQIPKPNPVSDLQRKLAANVAANSSGAAYKPPVAGAAAAAAAKNTALAGNAAALAQLFGKGSNPAMQQQLLALLQGSIPSSIFANLTPQQKEMMQRMGQGVTAQLMAAAALQQRSGQQLTKEQQQMLAAAILQQTNKTQAAAQAASTTNSNSNSNSNATAATSAASAAVTAAAAAATNSGTSTPLASSGAINPSSSAATALAAAASSGASTAQKLAAARHAFRKTADGQLVTQTVMPKACPNELFFIPNPNAPDFLYMLGLDQVVGRVLRDKNAYRNVSEAPYECEECGCDFATGWKCIGTKEEDLHLYCEGCLRQAQKKKLRHDRNSQLKKIYSKVALQEKEFEKQISDGKLDGMLATVFAQLQGGAVAAAAAANAARPTAAASPAVQNLSTKPATPAVPSPMQKPATPLQSTPSGSKTTSTVNSTTTSSGTKRPATANNNTQLQTQLAQLAQLARSNPMMAAMMSGLGGGMMGNQAQAQAAAAAAAMSYAPMLQQQLQQMQQLQARMQQHQQQQQQQQQQQASSSNSNAAKASSASSSSAAASNSNSTSAATQSMAMNMLAQAMQQSRSGAGGSSNNTVNANALAMAQMAALSQQAALAGQPSPFSNPQQLLRQMQLAAAQIQKNSAKK